MSSIEARLAALEVKVEALDERAAERSAVEAKILEAARQWGRLTKLGYYLETMNGRRYRERPGGEELASLLRLFERHIRHFSEELVTLETT